MPDRRSPLVRALMRLDADALGRGTRARGAGALALALATVVVASACSPAPSLLSDPGAILDAAVTHLQAARTVHLEASVEGTLAITTLLDPGGPQSSGRGLGLTGTHIAGDIDLAGERASIRFQVPALLGLEGEIREVGSDAYLQSSLTSRGWHRLAVADLPAGLDRPVGWIDALTAWLVRPGNVPVRLEDAPCRAGTCYVVRLVASRDQVDALASSAPGLGAFLATANLSVDLRVDHASLVLSEATFHVGLGSSGSIAVSATLSAWDAPVTVEAPPASEVVTGPLFP